VCKCMPDEQANRELAKYFMECLESGVITKDVK
jgi:hypothetical protein